MPIVTTADHVNSLKWFKLGIYTRRGAKVRVNARAPEERDDHYRIQLYYIITMVHVQVHAACKLLTTFTNFVSASNMRDQLMCANFFLIKRAIFIDDLYHTNNQ